ncbi:hypothetical protein [Streptomyces sp. RFCAC02]|uniref:hypothetical protein n=1 Tax=Streptomyces sp. RFCAC02 TaxID=2499143 RepID=UPI0010212D43|nr:hypothetical protein [Streptomyces sp. RFCAC02]
MNPQIEMSSGALADVLDSYAAGHGDAGLAAWSAVLRDAPSVVRRGHVADTRHWIDTYRRRYEAARATGSALAGELGELVGELTRHEGEPLALVMLSEGGRACFLWLTVEPVRLVARFTAEDRRRS